MCMELEYRQRRVFIAGDARGSSLRQHGLLRIACRSQLAMGAPSFDG